MGNRDKAHRLISGKGPEGRLIHGHVKIFGIQMFISNFHDVVYTSQTKNRFETYDLV